MPMLPPQRGFYDDIRGFQRKDVKVPRQAYAPTPAEQRRTQIIAGGLLFLFLGACLFLRLSLAREESRAVHKPSSAWKGVAVQPKAH